MSEKIEIFMAWLYILVITFTIQHVALGDGIDRNIYLNVLDVFNATQKASISIPDNILKGIKTDSGVSPAIKDWSYNAIGYFDNQVPAPCGKTITVAIIDTGIDYTHPELQNVIWSNPKDSFNKLDDDKNQFVDDVIGWDFVYNKPEPYDYHGHGTHIAGIIRNVARYRSLTNTKCERVKIMALKFYDNSGAGFNNLANTVKALQYAVNANVDIINYSGGGSDSSAAEMDVIKQARAKGIYLVASAGNDGEDLSKVPYYPASYNYENVIPVAGHDKNNELRKFSSYGKYVFVAAPGFSVLSAIPNDQYSTMSGTSQATAFVTGALAYILSQDIGPVKSSMSQIKLKLSKATKELKNNKDKSLTQWGSLYLPNLPKD